MNKEVLRTEKRGIVTKIEQSLGVSTWKLARAAVRASRARPAPRRGRPASRASLGTGADRPLPERARAAAGRGASVEVADSGGWSAFWHEVSSPEAVAALKLTLVASRSSSVINAVMGTLIAWVLVRDEFPGKRIVNALIDLPFALPTIVAGLVLLALYGPNEPVRHQHRVHARGGACSRCCS